MTPEQIVLVQRSFIKILPIKKVAAEAFYSRLFELEPSVRPMFKTDISLQGAKLMATIAMVVNGLNNLGAIIDNVRAMGKRHKEYGVQERHYGIVAEALLWMLEKELGPDFTPEVKEAWVAAINVLANAMIEAAREPATA